MLGKIFTKYEKNSCSNAVRSFATGWSAPT